MNNKRSQVYEQQIVSSSSTRCMLRGLPLKEQDPPLLGPMEGAEDIYSRYIYICGLIFNFVGLFNFDFCPPDNY